MDADDAPLRVRSPGGWTVPPGRLAAWEWLPPGGAAPRLDRAPWWLRAWYRTPFVDRWAHACLWRRGCWDVVPPEGPADVREPLAVSPPAPAASARGLLAGRRRRRGPVAELGSGRPLRRWRR